jgi:hypothetical protein
MNRLFYSNVDELTPLNGMTKNFALESVVPGVGILLNVKPYTVSSYFDVHVTSAEEFARLAQRITLIAKGITSKTKNPINVTTYTSKFVADNGKIGIKGFLVVSTSYISDSKIKIGKDIEISNVVDLATSTLQKILKAGDGAVTCIDDMNEILTKARSCIFPTSKIFESSSILESCFGGLDIKTGQKYILTTNHVGNVYVRKTIPQGVNASAADDIYHAFVEESPIPGLGCRIDSYAVSSGASYENLPPQQLSNEIDADGVIESLASYYIHWEEKSVIQDKLGTFMEHITLRTLELKTLKELSLKSNSIWVPSFDNNGHILANIFPGALLLIQEGQTQKHYGFILK